MDLAVILIVAVAIGFVALPFLSAWRRGRPRDMEDRRDSGGDTGASYPFLAGGDLGGDHHHGGDGAHHGDAGHSDGGGDGGGGDGGGGDGGGGH